MRKYLLLLVATCFLAGCSDKKDDVIVDPVCFTDFIWVNASDHRITMTVEERFDNEVITPGASLTKQDGFLAAYSTLSFFTRRGITIVFDDGPYGGVFDEWGQDLPIIEPNLQDKRLYDYKQVSQKRGEPIDTWTYTFTNADYEAAVARGSMTEE